MLTLDACQEVTCVHLQTWLCGVNLHGAAAYRILDASSKAQLALFLFVQYIVMVVARTILNLLIICIDVLSDWLWSAEIEWSTLYLQDLTCRDRCLIYREIVVCVNLTDDVVDGWSWVSNSLDREECVVGQVADGHLVGGCLILDDELIVVGQGISHPNRQFT